jgi:hypothetical protein
MLCELNKITYVLIFILTMAIILIVYYNCKICDEKKEDFINVKYTPTSWSRNQCEYILGKTIKEEFLKYNINEDKNNWNLMLPCTYDNPKKETKMMPIVKDAKYFIIENSDIFVAKDLLWKNLVEYYGIENASKMMPKSYVLNSNEDMNRFEKEYDNKKLYIMKKNLQRQEGLKITKNKEEILNGKKNKFILVQELLQNPYLIDGRKINLRIYILVLCLDKRMNVFVYNNGFMYYTSEKYVENSENNDVNITTGYIDRKVYEVNPLTHEDFKKYLDDEKRENLLEIEKNIRNQGKKISEICFNNINNLIKNIYTVFGEKICNSRKFENNLTFQLFGADVAIDNKLNAMIMEINKGPDMNAKDKRDSEVKHNVIRDIFRSTGIIDDKIINEKNGFINVLNK